MSRLSLASAVAFAQPISSAICRLEAMCSRPLACSHRPSLAARFFWSVSAPPRAGQISASTAPRMTARASSASSRPRITGLAATRPAAFSSIAVSLASAYSVPLRSRSRRAHAPPAVGV